ncbi:MAG: ABC-F family ATP-binding cassette domain-containing protein [Chitinispirillaceae bacterium]|nr:ABC-F family ATP-binding cassette domain-containing protein [Chitinispirillaceae bacterium]
MISFENVSKQYGGTIILEKASFAVNEQERTGLIGANGSGKTTLLRMLSGEEEPDRGTINKPTALTIGYLPQEVEVFNDKSALEIVLMPFQQLLLFEERMQSIGESAPTSDERMTLAKIDALHTAMEVHDGYSLQARAEAILNGLGITSKLWSQPVRHLSGGFRMRAVLGKLLLIAPDFLLLDEPTNHLDMDSLVWLEKYLSRSRSGMLVVSHDRDFLNRITTFTAGIGSGKVIVGAGNYDHYMRVREDTLANDLNRAKNIAAQIAQNERFVERFKAKATKATQAQSRMKLIERLHAQMPDLPAQRQATIRFSFPVPKPTGTVPLQLKQVHAGYDDGPAVINNLSLSINRGDKIAIIGPNGAGKTTLLKLLAGNIAPLSGRLETGSNIIIRYFGQHQLEQLNPAKTCYETVMQDSVNTEKTFIRNILGAFLFIGDAVDKTAGVLSGGEKARLVLATILASPGNVLLLDEPTNHLDIDSIEMLSSAMAGFAGTIVFVSHDEYFISRIANRIIEMRPGLVRDYPGTLADYRFYLETLFGGESASAGTMVRPPENNSVAEEKTQRLKERQERKKLQRAIEKCERSIETVEADIARLERLLHDPANACNHELLHRTTIAHAAAQASLEKLLQEWETKQSDLEALG